MIFFYFCNGYSFAQEDPLTFSCLEMPVNLTQYRRALGAFNNRNFSFNYSLKGHVNRMTILYAVLKRENVSISNNTQIFLNLVGIFLSFKDKYYNTTKNVYLHIFV